MTWARFFSAGPTRGMACGLRRAVGRPADGSFELRMGKAAARWRRRAAALAHYGLAAKPCHFAATFATTNAASPPRYLPTYEVGARAEPLGICPALPDGPDPV